LGAGIIANLGRPGGNVTGLTDQARDVQGKRLQLLLELIPGKNDIAVLLNPDTPFSRLALEEAKTAAEYGHIALQVLEARTADQITERIEEAVKAGVCRSTDPRRPSDLQHPQENCRFRGAVKIADDVGV
jgi:putative ABC transport system substrate-binding protein